jgi:hypothetical protein
LLLLALGGLAVAPALVPRVRAQMVHPAAAPAGRYALADETVTDTKTHLIWQRRALAPSTQQGGDMACLGLQLPGTGWRLPTVKELATLADPAGDNGLDAVAFASEPDGAYWSSTTRMPQGSSTPSSYVMTFGITMTSIGPVSPTEMHPVRCVR